MAWDRCRKLLKMGKLSDSSENRARWHRVDALVDAALDQAPPERRRFLDRECDGNASLRREVESLLAVDGEAEGFLETPAAPPGLLGTVASGERIGPYRVERVIGAGGMGVVYLATRADDAYRGRVAIKLLQAGAGQVGLAGSGLMRRFQGERQILASLDHPSIARLLDGGAIADGRPYLVMEYIDGLPIDEYCSAHRLTVRQRLALFRKVCAAVHYAHQNLVVHRDVKPSNILVTTDGEPRLLDFGIAKLLDPEQFPITVEATTAGLRPMTPSYASPEQVRGGAITTASDVYSLGVLLYRLLAGRPPHRLTGRSAAEVEHILSEKEPLRLSSAVVEGRDQTAEAASLGETARRRGVRPQQLRRQLEGDLDQILAKALRAEPAARYGSVEQLSEDLRRHLGGLPVLARQGAFGYQLATFLRRNRLAVVVTGLVLALVVAFAAAMARQASLTARQRDLAEQERARAEQLRRRAERVSSFLIDLFQGLDPLKTTGEEVTARELLERGVDKIERELPDEPEVRASLQDAIGTAYSRLARYDLAEPLLEAALATREGLLGGDHLDVAESLAHLSELYRDQGRYDEAEQLCLRALAIREAALGPDHPGVAEVLRYLTNLHRSQGRYAEAEAAGRRALAIYRGSLGTDSAEVGVTLGALAGAVARQGRLHQAQQLLEESLAIGFKTYGEVHTDNAAGLYNLGNIRLELGAPAEAEELFRRALASWRKILGDEHPNIAAAHLGLASVAEAGGRPAEEKQHLESALALYRATVGDDHHFVGICLYRLGHLRVRSGQLEAAAPLLERSLEIREERLSPDHPWTGESLCGLADLARLEGRVAESVALCRRARTIWDRHPGHSALEHMPEVCAAVYRDAGREAEALEIESLVAVAQ